MAGDWIKMRSALTTCPKVAAMARGLGTSEGLAGLPRQALRLMVIGALHSVWSAVNEHTADGVMANAYPEDLDDIAGIHGFGMAMSTVGWLEVDSVAGTLTFPNFDQWNTPGKDRTNAERQRRHRERNGPVTDRNGVTVTERNGAVTVRNAVTVTTEKSREEKRREETHTPFGRVCVGDTRTQADGLEAHGVWEAFRQAWNATANTKPYNALGCPPEALTAVLDPVFLADYPKALERLGKSTFFSDPASVTFFMRNWGRILAGEFDGRIQKQGREKAKAFQLDEVQP
jgi:hypothetical protein